MVQKNLRNSFPEKSAFELHKIEKQFYESLCDYGVETLKLASIKPDDLSKRMKFVNLEVIEEYKQKGQSVIIFSSHVFNWEWLLASAGLCLPLPIDFVYQTVNNKFFNDFSRMCRTRFGAHAINRDDVAREIVRRKNIQRVTAIIADQYPGLSKDKRYKTTFMHQETVFFQGANQLATLTQFPVVFAAVKKVKRGYYEARFEKIAEPPYMKEDFAMIERYITALEQNIRENPSEWLWSHNRWKKRHLKQ